MSEQLSRRSFCKRCAAAMAAPALPSLLMGGGSPAVAKGIEARYYEKLPDQRIRCVLCPRRCVVAPDKRGFCEVRENRGGVYYTLVHSRPCTANVDPIEKKPFFHFLPGTQAFSLATVGCNVDCMFCQNWEISQARPEEAQSYDLPPAAVARLARQYRCASIAYTYTEPIVFSEYVLDCAQAGRQQNVRNVMVSNGFINPEPLLDLCGVLDAIKIDLKAFRQKFYTEIVQGFLRPVMDTLVTLKKQKKWTEIVYLVIPTKNDDEGEIREMCQWVASDLGKETPVHFTRFHPEYRLRNLPPTPVNTLRRAREIGLKEGLYFVYVGNVPGEEGENTFCPQCGKVVIGRVGYTIRENNLRNGRCGHCGGVIAGVWE
ncbi:MAG: AmmeMemoRadiSam system radical SAM enzyme [candidate division KSB1 bacterium]|nr:AmmeMemoRadiSam system radical SAM enzyme [candidate division KSB1 bacterium]MDZ7295660.1 AmmeMemoRadiSam system radical SAM enzyme [candidate division KSB1 bacterium]MDZ7386622.1 AmmeMemoRadiSam system radical SAM enzyme [candidate division KSB1 bacterium]MDZ7391744.1 AmmeMemoRadiSam system radical SAM enzyme [candidate division KSB1 bacterium]